MPKSGHYGNVSVLSLLAFCMGGVLTRLKSQKRTILMVGLPGSGKTTILYKLKMGEVCSTHAGSPPLA